jgi:KUP system potassium uptake protein
MEQGLASGCVGDRGRFALALDMTLTPFHIAFPVDDLAAARGFYGGLLGCREGRSAETWVDFDLFGHQVVAHLKPRTGRPHHNPVDGHDVPVPHFGVVLEMETWRPLAARLQAAGVTFVIEPYIRFEGQVGEQATMFLLDPAGNALERSVAGLDARRIGSPGTMTAKSDRRFRPQPVTHTGKQQRETTDKGPTPLAALMALGVVYGDLGTSPLYTMQTIVQADGGQTTAAAALGVLSLIVWTLILTVSVKYCVFVMRADNHGEGGILALMSLVGANRWQKGAYLGAAMGLLGAALIYGDGVITPSISVLSAVEGLNVATPAFKPYVLPMAVAILLALFLVQRFGTAKIGRAFGPVMLVWFLTIGAMGLAGIARHPGVAAALNPWYAVQFLVHSGPKAALILGGVFLCATGGEALYADMGHVGRFPIRLAWYVVVLPALVLSYAGQAAMLLDGHMDGNPFFRLAPGWALYPTVGLATLATIIASQAIITGSFSMTRQAIQLGWLPMFDIRQTSRHAFGQIYVPTVNWLMAGATLGITLAFRSSDKLAGAYGTAVSTTMLLTTLLLYRAMTRVWRWPLWGVIPAIGVFLVVDLSFFSANILKLADGGWIPLALGLAIFTVMITWRSGMQQVRRQVVDHSTPVDAFLKRLDEAAVPRPPGVAVFLTRALDRTPPLISDFVQTVGALRETVIVLSLHFEEVPRVDDGERASFVQVAPGFWRVDAHYGFMENPDLSATIAGLKEFTAQVDLSNAVFFGTRDFVVRSDHPAMGRWRTSLFAFLFRNGMRITDRFNLPPDRTLEIARQIAI